ncbi:MAG TPA: polyprenol phosphomannose-dependent alpha 1,6 mannosyltransferase MptB [Jatrophihabitans sp.]|nr:polyprenol phosphomannose-dependent alpha 1,6 mannosyltransferase MptB [Jatrophihabitans sp.]
MTASGLRADSRLPATALRSGWSAGWSLSAVSRAGLAGTGLIALGSFGAAALPANDPTRHLPVIGLLRRGSAGLYASLGLYYLGLTVLIIAWLLLGRLLLSRRPDAPFSPAGSVPTDSSGELVSPTTLRRMVIRWMLPLLVGMPLASSDLYSYSAQAQLARHGLDPYTTTPADLPAVDLGKFLDNVAWKWVDTPSPYGPLWVAVSKWVAAATGNHALISVLLLRLLPFGAVLLTARLLPVLAHRFAKRADLALWVAVANPLILVHAVGGGHNDAVMVALIVAGLVLVTRPGADWRLFAAGAAVLTLSAAVKSPGLVAIAFAVPCYLAGRPGWSWRDCARYCAGAVAIAVAVFAGVSLIAGVGLGWVRQVSSGVPVINFMSLPTLLAVLYRSVIGAAHAGTVVDGTVRAFRTVGTVLSALVLLGLWLRAVLGRLDRHGSVRLLAIALFSIVVLGPAVQPWYFTWALTIVAVLVARPRTLLLIAVGSISLTLLTRPMGSSLEASAYLPAVLAAVLAARSLLGPAVQRVSPDLSRQPLAADR